MKFLKINIGQITQMTEIIENLYLGSRDDAENEKWLQEHSIKVVISVMYANSSSAVSYEQLGITLHHFPMLDCKQPQDPLLFYDEIKKIIIESLDQCQGVLIHCAHGISRSAATIIAFLMEFHKLRLNRALQFVKSLRPIVAPNPTFMKYLRCHDELLFCEE